MDEKSKRLAAAKKKLHQYKAQRQKEEKFHKGDINRSQESLASSLNDDEEHTSTTTTTIATDESTVVSFNHSGESLETTTQTLIHQEYQPQIITSTLNLENNLNVKSNELTTTTKTIDINSILTPTILSFEQSLNQSKDNTKQEESIIILEKSKEKQFIPEPLYNNSDILISPQQQHLPPIIENSLITSTPTPQLVSMPSPINTVTYLQESPLILSPPTTFSTTIEQLVPLSSSSVSLEQHQQQQQEPLLKDKIEETNVNLQYTNMSTENIKVKEQQEVKNVIVTTNSTETIEKSTQCENNETEISKAQENFNDVIDNLQFELSKLRKENSTLLSRESELIQQLETGEKLVRDLRKEVNQFRQQGNAQKQLEELQDAIVVLSKSKMTIAEELNNEQDKNKELVDNLVTFENELKNLRSENNSLRTDMNNMKVKLEEEQKKNRILDDQRHQLGAQLETLKTKLHLLENTTKCIHHGHEHDKEEEIISSNSDGHTSECHHDHHHEHDHHHHDEHDENDHHHHHHNGDEGHDPHHHHHHDDHLHEDSHGHSHGDINSHEQHSHEDNLNHELVEMQKTLKRLNWENETYKTELLKLGPLKQLEPRFQELQLKNVTLKEEIDRLEHLVIQLQGENDTIGDYITLYQTQKLALRQHAKENDKLVAALSKERNDLLYKLTELNHAVDSLSKEKESTGKVIIEDKIRDLIVDVNSKVNETFTCSTCSGSRLMTV